VFGIIEQQHKASASHVERRDSLDSPRRRQESERFNVDETEEEDWKLILKGAQVLLLQSLESGLTIQSQKQLFPAEFVIVKEGDVYQKIYQIIKVCS
jgi:hypothetical protein